MRAPTAVCALSLQQPVARTVNNALFNLNHVRRVHQKSQRVCGDGYVGLTATPVAKPAFLFAIVEQTIVTIVQIAFGARTEPEIVTLLLVMTKQHQAWIRRRDRLLRTAVRSLHDRFNTLDHVRHEVRIDLQLRTFWITNHLFRQVQIECCGTAENVAGSGDQLLAVRMNRNGLLNRIVCIPRARGHALLTVIDWRSRAKVKGLAPRIAGWNRHLLACWTKQGKPILRFDLQINFLLSLEIIAHHDRQRDLIALGQHARRFVLDKERLKRLDVGFSWADATVFSWTDYGELPGRDVVGKFEIDLRAALFVCLNWRLPEQGFGKILAQPRRR